MDGFYLRPEALGPQGPWHASYIHPGRPFYLGTYGSFNTKSRALLRALGGGALGGRSALGGRPEVIGPLSAYDET